MSFSQYEERFVFHEDIPALRREVDKAVYAADINYSSQLEHRVNYSDGETGWFSTGMFITKDAQGKTIKAFGVSQDITEHKKAEEALIASETKLNYALKIANLAHWEYDVINEIFTFNNQFYSLFRTTAEKEGGYVMSPMQYSNRFVYPDDKQLVGYEIQRSIESSDPGYSGRVDHRIIYADGEIGYLSVRIFTFRNADGNIYRAFGVSQDITERKQAEEALRKSEVQLSSAVKIANLAYWELDLVKFNFTLNDRYFSLMHTTAENEGGYVMSSDRYLLRFVHPEDEQVLSSEIQKALETKDPYYTNEMELRMSYADGKLGFFLTRFYITKDLQGNTISAFGATQDITQNKLAEKALRASEYFLRKTQSVAHIGSFKYNIKSGTWENSETLDEIFGINNNYTKDIKGWIKLIHPAHRAEVLDVIKNNIVNNKRFDKEYRIIRHNDKQERWVLLLGDLEIDNKGRPVTLIGTIQDITERILREQEKKELDKQLQLRNKELEKMISDLKMMQGTLVQSEKMASLGLLSAGIAHEINNPLAFVSSNANRLKEYFQDTVSLLNKWQDLEPALKGQPDFELIIQHINEYKDQIDINFILQDFDKMMYGVQEGTQRIKKIVEGMRGFAHMTDNTYLKPG